MVSASYNAMFSSVAVNAMPRQLAVPVKIYPLPHATDLTPACRGATGTCTPVSSASFFTKTLTCKACDEAALNLLLPYRNNVAGLLEQLTRQGVELLNGEQVGWVDSYLEQNGAQAAFRKSPTVPSGLPPDKPYQLLLHSGPLNKGTLFHEIYHFIQSQLNLPGALDATPEEKLATETAWKNFSQQIKNPLKAVHLYYWQLPRLKSRLKKFPPQQHRVPLNNHQREWAKREIETCHFIKRYGKALGLGEAELNANDKQCKLYSAFLLLSYEPVNTK